MKSTACVFLSFLLTASALQCIPSFAGARAKAQVQFCFLRSSFLQYSVPAISGTSRNIMTSTDGNSGIAGAFGFSSLRNGTKLTMPRLKSFLKSRIDWFIAAMFVVPHQLYVALMSADVLERLMLR